MWFYFALLISVVLVVLGLSMFLLVWLAPGWLTGQPEAACHHGPYCLHVLPPWVQSTLWLLIATLSGWLLARMGWTGLSTARASRRVRCAAFARAKPIAASVPYPVYEAADSAVFAWTVGIWRPVILVSRGLRESLSPEELQVVLAHEQAHASGRDNQTLLVSHIINSALFFYPGMRRTHGGVRRSVEISADAFASRGTGDRLLVAMSVSRVARLLFDSTRSRSLAAQTVGAAFAHGELTVERVQRLVEERRRHSRRRLLCGIVTLVLVLTVFGMSLYSVTGGSLTGHPRSATCVDTPPGRSGSSPPPLTYYKL